MDFGEVLSKAGKIIWKFKVLWIFGILASCGQRSSNGGGGGGNPQFEFSGDNFYFPPGWEHNFRQMENFFDTIQGWQIAALVLGFFFFMLIFILIATAISTVGEIGLIKGTVKADDGAEKLGFGELFNDGKPFFWRVFGFNLLAAFAIMVAVLLLFIPLIGIGVVTAGIGLICIIPLICLLIPLSWLVSLVFKQIIISMVVDDLKIQDGIVRGWEVFRDNFGNILVLGLILGFGSLIIGIFLAVPLFFAAIPSIAGILSGLVIGSDILLGSGIAAAAIGFLIILPIVILLDGILKSYIMTAWTLTYRRLTGGIPAVIELGELTPDES